ncbi:MAG TPA: porin [Spirochaetota bacterium]|nr:porin [Spirochaetota bacterium]
MKKISIILGLLLMAGLAMAADFQPWVGVRGSYQAVFHTDLLDSTAAFEVDRARIGVEGEWIKDIYFQVEADAKNTKKGKGTELKVAFIRWSFLDMDTFKGAVEFGALTTTFARGLSGTEYAFINYDITTVPESYQYGVQVKGNLMNNFVEVIASVSDGEGLSTINTAKGLLYVGRVEITPLGSEMKDLREGNTGKTLASGAPMLSIGLAAALDNKAKTDDLGYTSETYNSSHLLADVTFKMLGFSIFGQFVMNSYDALSDGTYWGGVNKNVKESSGGFVQVGYNLKDVVGFELEPMVKFEMWNDVLNEGYGDVDTKKQDFAVGFNWYAHGHDFKMNVEYRHMLKDENFYFGKPPAEDYFGFRVTHKFGAKLSLASKTESKPASTVNTVDKPVEE